MMLSLFSRNLLFYAVSAVLFLAGARPGNAHETHNHDPNNPVAASNGSRELDQTTIINASEIVSIIELRPDHHLYFVNLASSDGQQTMGIAEVSGGEGASLIPAFGLEDATPREVFNAFAEPEQNVPAPFLEVYPSRPEEPQGWALASMDRDSHGYFLAQDYDESSDFEEKATFGCSDRSFFNWIPDGNFSKEWINPNSNMNNSLWAEKCLIPQAGGNCCAFAQRWRFLHEQHNVDKWTSYICGRSIGSHHWYCVDFDGESEAWLKFIYRDSYNNGWYAAFNITIPPDGASRKYAWYWIGANWDWRASVSHTKKGQDEFDIYVGWED